MPDLNAFLAGGGEMGARIRAKDWTATPLGPIRARPQSLRSALSICVRSATATAIYWGPEYRFLYNDGWAAFLGGRHPEALGKKAAEVMADIWPSLEDQFDHAFRKAEPVNSIDTLLVRHLGGVTFDSYWSYSLLPIASEDGTIGGLLAQAWETTESVLRRRRDALMLRLGEELRVRDDPDAVLSTALSLLAEELEAARVGYGEVDDEAGIIDVLACALRRDLADLSGRYPIDRTDASYHSALKGGRTIRIDDVGAATSMPSDELRERYRKLGIGAALVVPVINGERYRAMIFAHEEGPRRWTDGEESLLRAATPLVWREVSRARAERALHRSEERYRRIFEQANDIILTADLDQIITDINPAGAAAVEAPREEIVGRSIRGFVTQEGFRQTTRMLGRKVEGDESTTRHTLEVLARSGRVMEWEINSTLTLDDGGRPVGLHAIARDVSERRKAEKQQRLLVNELNHRVKNTLALVQGLALQSFQEGRDPAEARHAFQQRLAALAAAHDLLTRESWEGATLDELIDEAVGHLNAQEPRLEATGPSVTLGPKAAVSLVMALHELATNAAKYGALSIPGGRVSIDWKVRDGILSLEWREQDGPEVTIPERRGFGLRMIERALKADLAGGARIEFERKGLVCRIDAPLAEAAPRRREGE